VKWRHWPMEDSAQFDYSNRSSEPFPSGIKCETTVLAGC